MPHWYLSWSILRALFPSILALSCTLLVASRAGALTISVPGNAPTIQAGIVIAAPGDSVVVAPGTYSENLSMRSGITVTGTGSPDITIIDGRLLGPVLSCESVAGWTLAKLTFARGFN
ncbi:MAG TPA: hypothetical protein VNM87_13180, partial [Candidatus Udaeobacter sp.]|nr:hypothetical protein [Candidatus Udaeobacter sp.]